MQGYQVIFENSAEDTPDRQSSKLTVLCDHIREQVKDDPDLLNALTVTLVSWVTKQDHIMVRYF